MVKDMLELLNNQLVFRFPEVHPDCVLTVTLHRTLRIPDDGRQYPLPPSLGQFPAVHVDDHAQRVPKKWRGRGGIAIPMWQSEAMWVAFSSGHVSGHGQPWPFAVKVAAGKVSAITGKKWSKKLRVDDYCVVPLQPWLDGFSSEIGEIKQFVAAALGMGATVEGQVTGKEEFGGLQVEVVPMSAEEYLKRFPKLPPPPARLGGGIMRRSMRSAPLTMKSSGPIGGHGGGLWGGAPPGVYTSVVGAPAAATNYSSGEVKVLSLEEAMAKRPEMYSPQLNCDSLTLSDATMDCDMSRGVDLEAGASLDMGLGMGGRMKQQIYADPYGVSCWDQARSARVFVHMCNSTGWRHLTGKEPPTVPLSASDYTRHNMPWYHLYDESRESLGAAEALKGVKSVAEYAKDKKLPLLPENQPADVQKKQVLVLGRPKGQVRDGTWAK